MRLCTEIERMLARSPRWFFMAMTKRSRIPLDSIQFETIR